MISNIPLFFVFSSRRNKPALDVRFLAEKSILLIKIKFLFATAALSASILTSRRGLKGTCFNHFFFHPKGEILTWQNPYVFRSKPCLLSVF
jgi:hypothetical protein